MADFIYPLELEKIIIQLFSGSFEIFTAVAVFFIMGMAAYFRMTFLTAMFMGIIFLTMFSGYVDKSLVFLIISIGGLLVGYWISKLVKN